MGSFGLNFEKGLTIIEENSKEDDFSYGTDTPIPGKPQKYDA